MKNMSLFRIAILVAFAGLFVTCVRKQPAWQAQQPGQQPGRTVSSNSVESEPSLNFDVQPLFGAKPITVDLTMAKKRHMPVILHFWGTWCPPCVREMPSLLAFLERYKGKANIALLAVDDERDEVIRFLNAHNALTQEKKVLVAVIPWEKVPAKAFAITGVPTTIFINGDGSIAASVAGGIAWESADVARAIRDFEDGKPLNKKLLQ